MPFPESAFPGRFISFEGIDGAGKSTHLSFFFNALQNHFPDRAIVMTREPGGTPLGEILREQLLNLAMHSDTEALLMFAARREHLAQIIEPALLRGDIVISDRFTDSSFAYQCGGRGIAVSHLEVLESWVQTRSNSSGNFLIEPELTILFDLSPEMAQERRSSSRTPDKFEELDLVFFNKVRDEYLRRVAQSPERFIVIDSSQPIETIQAQLQVIVNRL